MNRKARKENLINRRRNDRGTTLVEMIVCFALLGIFMVSAAALISTVTSTYYRVRGEIYSREVSDIVLGKIASEIDGAKFFETDTDLNPKVSADNKSIDLCDKTDTYLNISRNNNDKLEIKYYAINGSVKKEDDREESYWYYDDSVYNGFKVTDLLFYRGKTDSLVAEVAETYGLSGVSMSVYNDDVVLVLLKMEHERYGVYYFYRFVKMYNSPTP